MIISAAHQIQQQIPKLNAMNLNFHTFSFIVCFVFIQNILIGVKFVKIHDLLFRNWLLDWSKIIEKKVWLKTQWQIELLGVDILNFNFTILIFSHKNLKRNII